MRRRPLSRKSRMVASGQRRSFSASAERSASTGASAAARARRASRVMVVPRLESAFCCIPAAPYLWLVRSPANQRCTTSPTGDASAAGEQHVDGGDDPWPELRKIRRWSPEQPPRKLSQQRCQQQHGLAMQLEKRMKPRGRGSERRHQRCRDHVARNGHAVMLQYDEIRISSAHFRPRVPVDIELADHLSASGGRHSKRRAQRRIGLGPR